MLMFGSRHPSLCRRRNDHIANAASGGARREAGSTVTDAPDLKLRLADLVRLRADHAAQGKWQLVTYLDALIREIELEIAHRAAAPPPAKPR